MTGVQTCALPIYDDSYTGLAASLNEGERLAGLMENKSIMFLKNHGVITVGNNMAEAYRLLYKLERACKTQVLAMSTGQPIHVLEQAVIDKVRTPSVDDRHPRSERDRLYFEAMMRVIDRINPGYAD